MNRDNQPTFNTNRNIANFGDFSANIDAEKEELKKVKRSTTPNSERQQHLGNKRFKFNKVTRKMDDLSQDEVTDNIDAIEELQEGIFSKDVKEEQFQKKRGSITGKIYTLDEVTKLCKDAYNTGFRQIRLMQTNKPTTDFEKWAKENLKNK